MQFVAERRASATVIVVPTEKESFTKFMNGLYRETQLILLTQMETHRKPCNNNGNQRRKNKQSDPNNDLNINIDQRQSYYEHTQKQKRLQNEQFWKNRHQHLKFSNVQRLVTS